MFNLSKSISITLIKNSKTIFSSTNLHKQFEINGQIEFEQKVLKSIKPVIVNFHADWCDPCQQLSTKMNEIVDKYERDVDLAYVNVDKNENLVDVFDVKAVPAVLAFRNGDLVHKFIGVVDGDVIENLIDKLKKNIL